VAGGVCGISAPAESHGWASLFTSPFGLTEPLFVPAYSSPPSLFDLARTTGFDIKSVIFSFGIGGVGAVLYNLLTGRELAPVADADRRLLHHKLHDWALAAPLVSFPILYLFPWNSIYPAIVAMILGAAAAIWCRPDLARKAWVGAILFVEYYAMFLMGVELTAPGYIERVWNLGALSGLSVAGMPIRASLYRSLRRILVGCLRPFHMAEIRPTGSRFSLAIVPFQDSIRDGNSTRKSRRRSFHTARVMN
jgi:hypothetical protein